MPQDIQFVTVKSAHLSSNSSTTPSRQLVVKVCDTSDDENKTKAAVNEANILKKINCDLINQFVAFYEDPEVAKSYIVLEYAGEQSLKEFMAERKEESDLNDVTADSIQSSA
mmetsp:Transcript_16621/g.22458  ORF Transcript_16621/g.22458 Transcript_16621/m.22458 type:complete len:112 (+) Transcript_16621:1307-1642(+)